MNEWLLKAALWDNAELLEDLLHGEQLGLINSQDSWGRTPLHAAAITENSKCLRILLSAGSNSDIQCGPRGESKVGDWATCTEALSHLCAVYVVDCIALERRTRTR